MMKRQKRIQQILTLLQMEPELTLADVCGRTESSEATVRRAFVELERAGQIERTWGGVRLVGSGTLQMGPPAFARRMQDQPAAKKSIARCRSDRARTQACTTRDSVEPCDERAA